MDPVSLSHDVARASSKAADIGADPTFVLIMAVVAVICLFALMFSGYIIVKKIKDADTTQEKMNKIGHDIHDIRGIMNKEQLTYKFVVESIGKDVTNLRKDVDRVEHRVEGIHSAISGDKGISHRISRLEGEKIWKAMQDEERREKGGSK